MMDYELTLTKTLRRAVDQFGDKEIVTKLDDGGTTATRTAMRTNGFASWRTRWTTTASTTATGYR